MHNAHRTNTTKRVLSAYCRTVQSRTISGVSTTTVTVSSAFSSAPQSQSIYTITSSTLEHQKFRCIDVIDNNDGTYTIEGVQFNDSIYAAADNNTNLSFTDITAFDETPTPPVNLHHTVMPFRSDVERVSVSGNFICKRAL